MEPDIELVENVARLARLEVEYAMTICVLAVLVERLQQLTGASLVQLAFPAVTDHPDLRAWRDEDTGMFNLQAGR
jgi:hypothetical protein